MFKKVFSFKGRIRRKEYGITLILFPVLYFGVIFLFKDIPSDFLPESLSFLLPFILLLLPFLCFVSLIWMLLAQGAKRCHDIGYNGWWQLIPLFGLVMLFQDGVVASNKYGHNPKINVDKQAIDSIGA
jgi:uncharacterized membrane protein YhaH (DUF805 family)